MTRLAERALEPVVERIREAAGTASGGLAAEVAYETYLEPVPVAHGTLERPLPSALVTAAAASGAERLWSHQAEALDVARRGGDVLITTPTASGKSLVFQLPVLEEALAGGPGRALFLFPLKALGQDQKVKLDQLAGAAGLGTERAVCEIYDGDTPRETRAAIKAEPPRVLISNPDMLHLGLLANLADWCPFLRDLRWIVLDELHTYRGIFGSHFHHVLRRLLRACRAEGARPSLIASSATAANAGDFAEILAGRPFHWVERSGAPREGRHLLLLRPAASPYTTVLRLFTMLVSAGLKTIVFTKARRITELLYSWLKRQDRQLARRVRSYRSGFLPSERRKIERRLFDGELDGVISTSALEMGIDVGGLDACILVGFPGSMMATWQRSGRVGRSGKDSLTALVALPDALDQYLLDHPQELLERPCERLFVDPMNEPVSRGHIVCAASEIPLRPEADREYLERYAPLVGELLRDCRLVEAVGSDELVAGPRRPQREISLRGSGQSCAILDAQRRRTIGTVDGVRVLHECHPGAVYLHAGRQYLVRDLDLEGRKVYAEPVRVDYYTTPLTEKETEVVEVLDRLSDGPLEGRLGRLEVTERVVGYERKQLRSQEVLGRHPLELPPSRFETVGLWWEAPRAIEEQVRLDGGHFLGSLHAAEHAAISLFPLLALCDRNDIGGISYPLHPQVEKGAVFVYDGHPGGIGLAARVFRDLPGLLARVVDLLSSCPCEGGCPSCVQSPKCGNGNRPLDKAGARRVLRLLLGRDEPSEEARRLAQGARRPERRKEPRRPDLGNPDPAMADKPAVPAPPAAPSSSSSASGIVEPAVVEPVIVEPPLVEPPPARRPVDRAAPAVGGRFGRRRRLRPGDPGHDTILFDIETRRAAKEVGGWGKSYRMGIAVAVACHLEEGRIDVFREADAPALGRLLRSADLVVGFNVLRFDYAVLSGYTGEDYRRTVQTLDLCEEVHRRLGFRLGLSALASATLGADKSADGLQSLEWVSEGRLDLVEDYCKKDVELLRDLYLHGRREGCLFYRDKEGRLLRLPVDW